ncbi:hypothetical protein [Flavobacterium celericrescens]|uniref:Glycerophosphoryl diester phosphodiesterase membrane domain-containing protein n=1 Tax=Flavobacterium celericrescens TaxID=2709780 RepID=A0ABX0I9R1_9FLAO|nr:hypothetical protein [Flavobacterium celericrescens]NHM03847.1 hypothetical protein [Flavobacterium celericrescens]
MFQLYKKRDFSALVGDTFNLFKLEGKNYFKNYFIINGGLLLLLVVILYFFMKIFLDGAFTAARTNNDEAFLNTILSDLPLFIGFGFGMILLIILASLINYIYPVAYLKLIEENQDRNTQNLIQYIKSKIGKTILFYILSIFVAIPILFIIMALTFLLVFVIIGIPLLFILIPAYTSWISLSYYHYISTDAGYFEALIKGYELLRSKFWPVIGSNFVMQTIVQITLGILIMVPYFIGIASILVNPEGMEQNPEKAFSFVTIMLTVIMIISILFNYTLQNIILINQGIIYYSIREEQENISVISSIDSIGTNEE